MSEIRLDEDEDPRWTNQGISFSLASEDDRDAIWTFLQDCFFPDEPLVRSAKLLTPGSIFSSDLRKITYEGFVKDNTEKGKSISVMAKNRDGDILGEDIFFVIRETAARVR